MAVRAGPPGNPTLDLASLATGIPLDRLALLARLFVAPEMRRCGLGRELRCAAAQAPAMGRRAALGRPRGLGTLGADGRAVGG